MARDVAIAAEDLVTKSASDAAAAEPGASAFDQGDSCTDYCPNAACACRARTFAGCSLPLRGAQPRPPGAAGNVVSNE